MEPLALLSLLECLSRLVSLAESSWESISGGHHHHSRATYLLTAPYFFFLLVRSRG